MEELENREEERGSRVVSKKISGGRGQQGKLPFLGTQPWNQLHEREQRFSSNKIKSKWTSHQKGVRGFTLDIKCAKWPQILDVHTFAIRHY